MEKLFPYIYIQAFSITKLSESFIQIEYFLKLLREKQKRAFFSECSVVHAMYTYAMSPVKLGEQIIVSKL